MTGLRARISRASPAVTSPRRTFLETLLVIKLLSIHSEKFETGRAILVLCESAEYFRGHICQFAFLPSFHLLPHRFKVRLHAVDTNRDAVNERERLERFVSTGVNTPETMFPN
jgi:hypothetical protein